MHWMYANNSSVKKKVKFWKKLLKKSFRQIPHMGDSEYQGLKRVCAAAAGSWVITIIWRKKLKLFAKLIKGRTSLSRVW